MRLAALTDLIAQAKSLEDLALARHRDATHPTPQGFWGVAWVNFRQARVALEKARDQELKTTPPQKP